MWVSVCNGSQVGTSAEDTPLPVQNRNTGQRIFFKVAHNLACQQFSEGEITYDGAKIIFSVERCAQAKNTKHGSGWSIDAVPHVRAIDGDNPNMITLLSNQN
jgi:hypothetical protein